MARVRIEHVHKIYGGKVAAVKDVCLDIPDREFLVLVGPSGCGKSTTLRMVAGLEEISSGDIYIGDRRVNDVPPKDRDIAMVFQNYALYPHMTVRENMAFALKLRGCPRSDREHRVSEAAALLNIGDLLERKPKELSGGQRQRVAVGRAIVRQPQVFLFDEPLSNLDAKMRVQMRAEISRLHLQLKTTMIYVTHDQAEAMTMGDRIVVMKDGEVQQVDAPLALYDRPCNQFVAGFIGNPPMNFIRGEIFSSAGSLHFRADGGWTVALPRAWAPRFQAQTGKAMTLGLRPEHWILGDATSSSPAACVDLVEPMGAETHLHMSIGPHKITVRSSQRVSAREGDPFGLAPDLSHAHFFEPESGRVFAGLGAA